MKHLYPILNVLMLLVAWCVVSVACRVVSVAEYFAKTPAFPRISPRR